MVYLKWRCLYCNEIVISNDNRHHVMDFCKSKCSGCDFEKYGIRWSFKGPLPKVLKKYNYNFFDELVLGLLEQKLITLVLLPKTDGTQSMHVSIGDVFMIRDLEDEIVESLK